jgi:hypothetical protein
MRPPTKLGVHIIGPMASELISEAGGDGVQGFG